MAELVRKALWIYPDISRKSKHLFVGLCSSRPERHDDVPWLYEIA